MKKLYLLKRIIGWTSIFSLIFMLAPVLEIPKAQAQIVSLRGTLTEPDGITSVSNVWIYVHNQDWSNSNGTYTDTNGAFSILDLPAGDYEMEIAEGTSAYPPPDPIEVSIVSGQVTELGTVKLVSPNVYGKLLVPDTSVGISGMYVYLYNYDLNVWKSNYTSSDGTFNLYTSIPGDYNLEIYNSYTYNSTEYWPPGKQTITITAGQNTDLGNIYYKVPNVTGTLTEPDSTTPVSGGSITIRNADWSFSRYSTTSSDGSFNMYVPSSGDYLLEIWTNNSSYPDPEPQNITINAEVTNNFNISLPSPNIYGKITEPDNTTPVSGVSVDLHNANWSVSKYTSTDADGKFNFYLNNAGTYKMEFWYSGETYSRPDPITVDFTAGETKYYDGTNSSQVIRLLVPSMRGKILKPDSSVADGASVSVHDTSYSYDGSRWGSANSQGVFKIDSLATGTYSVEISPPWSSSGEFLVAPDPFDISLTKGTTSTYYYDNPIILSYAQKTISGKVTKSDNTSVTDAYIQAWRRNGSGWAETQTDSNGSYSLKVGKGKWQVSVYPRNWPQTWGYNKSPKTVEFTQNNDVAESQTHNFVVAAYNSVLKGRLLYPDGSVPPLADYVSISVWSMDGQGNWGEVDSSGYFEMKLPAGTFELDIYSSNNTYGAPDLTTVTLAENETLDLGYLYFVEKNEFIKGRVTDSLSNPLQNQWVDAWKTRGSGWANTETDANGEYSLNVTPGSWMVNSWPNWSENTVYVRTQEPQRVVLNTKETKENVNFQFAIADATIKGTVQKSDGTVLSDLYGWAFAEKDNQTRDSGDYWYSGLGGNVDAGVFTIKVPAGTWRLGVWLPWGSDYSASSDSVVTISSGQTVEDAKILVLPNDATIQGNMLDVNGNKVDVWGSVFADNGAGGYQWSDIENGSYSLKVSAGSWRIGYWVDWDSGYLDQPLDSNKVTVASEETKNFDITLLKADSTITGTVTDPDGNPMANAWISADTKLGGQKASHDELYYAWYNRGKITDQNGRYTMQVPAGSYFITASLPPDMGYINPQAQKITVDPNNPATVDLQFVVSDGQINGQVTLNGELNPAFVWGYSETGGYSENYTDNGNYSLNVTKNNTWHIGAVYETSTKFYKSAEVGVDIPDSGEASQDLVLTESSIEMPAAETATFAASSSKSMTLSDETTIFMPAYSLTTNEVNVTVTATPKAQIPNQAHAKPIGIGYDLEARYASGSKAGQEITSFASDVSITLPYTDAQLVELGISEDDIQPMYYDETAGTWKTVENVVVDKENNTVSFTVRHFTTFAITTGESSSVAPVITLESPEDNTTVTVNSVVFEGTVSDPNAQVTIKRNGSSTGTVSVLSSTGGFTHSVTGLSAGNNTITVDASNSIGNAATITRTIKYQGASTNGEEEVPGVATGVNLDLVIKADNGSSYLQIYDNQGVLKKGFFAYSENFRGDIQVVTADIDGDGAREIITAPGNGKASHVRIFSNNGTLKGQFYAYSSLFRGGVEVKAADINADSIADIVTKPKQGGPNIRAYKWNSTTVSFELIDWFMAFQEDYRGELSLEIADVTSDNQNDIILAPKENGGPNVRIYTYDSSNQAFKLVDWFMAFHTAFRGGLNLSVADINGNGTKDIVVAPYSSGGPNLRVYEYNLSTDSFDLLGWVMAYASTYRSGLELKLADIDSDNDYEIITKPTMGGPNVRVFNFNSSRGGLELLDWFWAYPSSYRVSFDIGVSDADKDNNLEIVVAPKQGGANIRLYEYSPDTQTFELLDWFMAFQNEFKKGANLKITDIEGDGDSDLIITPFMDGGPNVRIYKWNSTDNTMKLDQWFMAFDSSYRLGLEVYTVN